MEAILLFAQIVSSGAKLQGGATVEANASPVLSNIDVTPSSVTTTFGQTTNFYAYGTYKQPIAAIEILWEDHPEAHMATDLTSQCVWSSSNPAVATLGPAADPQPVTAVGIGQSNITCTIGSISGFGQLTVSGMVVSPASVSNAVINVPYTVTFSATGGVATPVTFSITNGLTALNAAGLNFSGATLSGTPTAAGTYAFTVQVTDSSTPPVTGSRQYNLTVQPPAGTNTRQAHLPKVWGNPHEGDFPSTGVVTKYVHTDGSGNYACNIAGLQQSVNDWVSSPVGEYREVIVDDGMSTATGGQCRVAAGTTPLSFNAKLGATGWFWMHSAHVLINQKNVCGQWNAIDIVTDQRTVDCPAAQPSRMFYLSGNATTPNGNVIRLGSTDSAGNGPSHYRLSGANVESLVPNYQHFPVYMLTSNQTAGNLPAVCSHIGLDYNYFHLNYNDLGISANPGPVLASNMVRLGCRNSWFNWNQIDRYTSKGLEGKPISLTDVPPHAGVMVVGNWFEGGAESFFIGGAVPALGSDYGPSDIEFRKNYFAQNPLWVIGGTGAGTACGNGTVMKNLGEMKIGERVLFDANVFQWSNGCGQSGQTLTLNVRACSAGIPCDAYGAVIADITVSNNVFRHAGTLVQTDGRSQGNNAGISVSLPGRRWNFVNNVTYDIANNNRHTGNTPNYFFETAGVQGPGTLRFRCKGVRDSLGVVTLDCSDYVYQQVATVTVTPTTTQANLTTACTTCNIVTLNFVTALPYTAYDPTQRFNVSGAPVGINANGVRTPCNSSTGCPVASGANVTYRCGSPATSTAISGQPEPACPTGWTSGGTLARVGQLQTGQAPGDPTVVMSCADSTFNTAGSETGTPTGIAGPPALAGTNGVGPGSGLPDSLGGSGGGLIVKYQSIPGAPASTPDCTFHNMQGWFSDSMVVHNTSIGTAYAASFRNPHPRGGVAANTFPYEKNMLVQDNMEIIDPASQNGGVGLTCCVQTEGLNSLRAGYDLGSSEINHITMAGRSGQAANYRQNDPTCFGISNCLQGNAAGTTLWFPSVGPCPGATVTTSGSGWVSGTSCNGPGFRGMMNGVPFLLVSNDPSIAANGDPLTDYSLQPYNTVGTTLGNTCTANCGSPYAAGGPRQAHDGTDMGADMNKVRHALQRTIYDDCSAATGTCGAGPNPE